ncbi:hypothetical protein [Cellulomonas soli]|uniref:Uncharacterized protein n=1 Tax=Cellulomonas soli TaxID=931535 RepID=A0A512PEV8_9CELL|nr:hypothetical protein [Cellulomonas soli]NYI59495.1 hypothetical protein [Cellulomonas soli]GEP69713.1 hypothetical protein CSO01_24280 [Cellulomonas soli]
MASTLGTLRRRPSSTRVFWASSLAAVSLAGLYASARAAEQLVVAAPAGCDVQSVDWSYEIGLDARTGYGITGTRFVDVPDACEGVRVQVLYRADGSIVRRSEVVLHDGTVDLLGVLEPAGTRVTDASWVVLPD